MMASMAGQNEREKEKCKNTAEMPPLPTLPLAPPMSRQDSPSCDLDSFITSMPIITTPSPYGSTPPCRASILIINILLRFPVLPAVEPIAEQYSDDSKTSSAKSSLGH